MEFKPINQWAEDDRPREKLELKGKNSLSNAELIAILLATGTKSRSALDLAKDIMNLAGNNINNLYKLSIQDICKINGIGKAKAITIIAALELGGRRQIDKKEKITTSKAAYDLLIPLLAHQTYELFYIILLNRSGQLINFHKISEGGLTSTSADPRKIFKIALENNASSIILAHNHPSGNKKPSQSDIDLTHKLKNGAKLFDIELLDHLIITNDGYLSFIEENII